MRIFQFVSGALLFLFFGSCQNSQEDILFSKMTNRTTGIDFRNLLKEDEDFNIFKYQYFNNGGGLAVGDFNNDGLQDLVFTGNMVKNRLYINRGDFHFDDITKTSGIAEKEGWCTGVTVADVNEDGWLDIYICRAGYPFDRLRTNLLFINNGDLTFTERAKEYGLDDVAYSTHSAFFDYDKDGDLDLFVLNHSTVEYSRGSLDVFQLRDKENPYFTNKLYRNDGGHFSNVTSDAGIQSNVLSFSLGISISDFNGDSWPDIFISNDFNEPDYLFMNNQNGTFSESLSESMDHTSLFSMGSDAADINNDGWMDLISLDMLPEGNYLQKMHSGVDNFEKVFRFEQGGFHYQYSRNMLQLNNGDGSFSELGQMAGVSNTDWSWAPLFFDFENDGLKDLFVANGYVKDHTDMDFLNFTTREVAKIQKGEEYVDFNGYMAKMPPILVPNYFFSNQGGGCVRFINQTEAICGLEKRISQSAAYVDLDNDGDLDLVLNNTGDYASVYQNNSDRLHSNNYLRVKLLGNKSNRMGIGSRITLYAGGKQFTQEQQLVRGFQSSVDPVLCIGLGAVERIDSIHITWPTGEFEALINIEVNQTIELNIKNGRGEQRIVQQEPVFPIFSQEQLPFAHSENVFNDFKIQALLPWSFSRAGPAVAVADVNKDGREDIYLGGGNGRSGQLMYQTKDGTFKPVVISDFELHRQSEDTDAVFFDANKDGFPDLYVCSGSYEFGEGSKALIDRLYINDGSGQFTYAEGSLPEISINTTCIEPGDFDGDGDLDLFVGGGYKHGFYPLAHPSVLLENDGNGAFKPFSKKTPFTDNVNDAVWCDINADNSMELVVVGEWSQIEIYKFSNGVFIPQTNKFFKDSFRGLWNTLHASDFDGDGDLDLVVGNLGLNSQLAASPNEPLELYASDFDGNGSLDPFLCYYVLGESWPFVSRDDAIAQLPYLKKKFLFFKEYAQAQIHDILTDKQIENSLHLVVNTLETSYFEFTNEGFILKKLPQSAQISPAHSIESLDVNKDGIPDLVISGNTLQSRVKLGRLDGNHGQLYIGKGDGTFSPVKKTTSGLDIRGRTTQLKRIKINKKEGIVWGVNNEPFMLTKLN